MVVTGNKFQNMLQLEMELKLGLMLKNTSISSVKLNLPMTQLSLRRKSSVQAWNNHRRHNRKQTSHRPITLLRCKHCK